jgi:mannose-6-phosphate isomerase-like protein (cupin superfamily)
MIVMHLKETRRVVTGHDESGKSVVLFDGPVSSANERNDSGIAQIWATDGAPADNQCGGDAALRPIKLVTPPSGSLFWLCKMAPMNRAPSARDSEQIAAKTLERLGGGGAIKASSARPDMHATQTLDYAIVLEGEVTLVLDEGEVTLKPFDTVVQRGTSHTWENRGTKPALIAFVLLDAKPVS